MVFDEIIRTCVGTDSSRPCRRVGCHEEEYESVPTHVLFKLLNTIRVLFGGGLLRGRDVGPYQNGVASCQDYPCY